MADNNQTPFDSPLVTLMLMLAANTPDPAGSLNNLGQAINSMREAVASIHAGLESFHSKVVPLLMQSPDTKTMPGE
ncbi:hypothetical protein SPSYN_01311 [Sporotomaculum syntrophicum]|uniref:Uncharacterized protein n=1 Tax=Sporotomaculum syntrophicum TaxID=182264 RepID=A0A9D2WQC1_9FIRM|nr:hypothetical protein [Sporotomaculum syntrophicum]KAF1085175.1 hypothetical protein SPSYN_01311 [Sporotomaculum syntrophicum]